MKLFLYFVVVYLTESAWSLNGLSEMTDTQRIIMDEMTWDVKLIFLKKYLEDRDKRGFTPDDSRRYVDLKLSGQKHGYSDSESEKRLNSVSNKQTDEDKKLEKKLSRLVYSLVKDAKQKKKHRPEMLILLLDKL